MDIDKFMELTKSPIDEVESIKHITELENFDNFAKTIADLGLAATNMAEGIQAVRDINIDMQSITELANSLGNYISSFDHYLSPHELTEVDKIFNDISSVSIDINTEQEDVKTLESDKITIIQNITIENKIDPSVQSQSNSNIVNIIALATFLHALLGTSQENVIENLGLIFESINKLLEFLGGA